MDYKAVHFVSASKVIQLEKFQHPDFLGIFGHLHDCASRGGVEAYCIIVDCHHPSNVDKTRASMNKEVVATGYCCNPAA